MRNTAAFATSSNDLCGSSLRVAPSHAPWAMRRNVDASTIMDTPVERRSTPTSTHLLTSAGAIARNYLAVYLNFCPPTLASYISPPLATVKTASPL